MTKNLRTALLATAVSSGLLLSSAPVQAQILGGEAETTQGAVTESIQDATVSVAETADEEPNPATVPDLGVAAAEDQETVGVEAVQDESQVDAQQVSTGSGSASEASETPVSPDGDAAETPDGVAVSETLGTGPVTDAGSDGTSGLATAPAVEPTPPGPTSTQSEGSGVPESEIGDATEVESDVVDLPWWLKGIEIPEGAENWTDAQWEDFIMQIAQVLENEPAFQELDSIIGELVEHGRETDLDALYEHLLWMFDGNEAAAQEAFEEIVFGLIESGVVDAGILDPKESGSPQSSARPEPTEPAETPKPEIKPAGTVTKPVLDQKPIVKAVLKPIMSSQTGELAETGSSDVLVYAGAGAAMLLLGAFALRMRRKPRGH
ncbi:LPXTG cell wall anchor domain-containing protein [Paeniglutamicibacter psychrophenolicus]|uniref:LPXTG cell wall anchor domain-containing protein n=1 Tax=Paeniglutamicibacter psychrophenolicus TaxID=257454 RepID=UPI0027834258|nr:LPXTG cell wall anchor domain-containing protein [Paeniglutamicibacter psychrophenolicus]MDQ0093795.1 LPXTG-motif cell wall-anchored protein [Paeniglutamicibacter psychrophenolicus]